MFFLPILHNIRLYIYTIRYKSGIKIFGFLRNISKKISKKFKKISQLLNWFPLKKNTKSFCFHAYDRILKLFQAYFLKKTKSIASFSCFKNEKNRYHNQFMIII
jgi:hypothetical protein